MQDGTSQIDTQTLSSADKETIKIAEFIKKVENAGFLSLDQLFGDGWKESALSRNIMDVLDRRLDGRKILDIAEPSEQFDIGTKAAELKQKVDRLGGYTEIVVCENNLGDTEYFLLTNRPIRNEDGREILFVHELIDCKKAEYFSENTEGFESNVWGYTANSVFFSVKIEKGVVPGSTYVDLQELGEPGREAIWRFMNVFRREREEIPKYKKTFSDRLARRINSLIGGASVSTLNDLLGLSHEFGHLAYSFAYEEWNKMQILARKIYKERLTELDGMTNNQARTLVGFDERVAWDVCEQLIDWLRFDLKVDITMGERLVDLPKEVDYALTSYDMTSYSGQGSNPSAFSGLMRAARNYYSMHGQGFSFDPITGDNISHCPLAQIYVEKGQDKMIQFMKETGLIPDSRLKRMREQL